MRMRRCIVFSKLTHLVMIHTFRFLYACVSDEHMRYLKKIENHINSGLTAKELLFQLKRFEEYLSSVPLDDIDRTALVLCMRSVLYKLMRTMITECSDKLTISFAEVTAETMSLLNILFSLQEQMQIEQIKYFFEMQKYVPFVRFMYKPVTQ